MKKQNLSLTLYSVIALVTITALLCTGCDSGVGAKPEDKFVPPLSEKPAGYIAVTSQNEILGTWVTYTKLQIGPEAPITSNMTGTLIARKSILRITDIKNKCRVNEAIKHDV